jgi:hypothetical protein
MTAQTALGFAVIISIIVGLFCSRLWTAVLGGLIVGLCQAALVMAFTPGFQISVVPQMRWGALVMYIGFEAILCAIIALSAHTFRRGIISLFRRRDRAIAESW